MVKREEIVAYLLGRLAEPERARLEERFFADTALFDELAATEDELVDEYVAGRLAGADRRSFDEYYLAAPERAERVAAARQLRAWVAREAEARKQGSPWWEQAAGWFRMPAWALGAAAAAMLVALGSWWAIRQQPAVPPPGQPQVAQSQPPAQTVPAQPPEPAPERPEQKKPPMPLFAFTLLPGTLRGAGGADLQTVTLPQPLPASARMQLRLEEAPDRPGYRVAIETPEGRLVWQGEAQPVGTEPALRATVPLAGLAPGDYLVRVTAAGGESIADYSMRVRRR